MRGPLSFCYCGPGGTLNALRRSLVRMASAGPYTAGAASSERFAANRKCWAFTMPNTHPLRPRNGGNARSFRQSLHKVQALSAPGFSRMIERAAVVADVGIKAHAHMLRHACGYKLANDGIDTRALQAYLGHRNIQNTTRYTALAPDRFKGFWRD